MTRLAIIATVALVGAANAFTVPQNNLMSSRVSPLFAEDKKPLPGTMERGVSMDQDGKSNVWAIEPKMEIENKSAEEKTGSTIAAVGGFVVFGAVAAFALTHLPDPNQF
eukprot:CAMPEP_0201882432 /NCGR_PEP_ID=MMETSP0902-20130614/13879_1 /ASSEMBLY_ACC=CAM_ASM_000551 /TAXON_ID=420261 /ORGANISM="Thalassiosira antarctica, Strain CCMP982" /LENGTH=108 /DNA_ID=CAMNT_0048410953 /DNA_START=41 /DNA_END=367 /DNA_ORIENTATION=+